MVSGMDLSRKPCSITPRCETYPSSARIEVNKISWMAYPRQRGSLLTFTCLCQKQGLAYNPITNELAVADAGNNCLRLANFEKKTVRSVLFKNPTKTDNGTITLPPFSDLKNESKDW